MNRWLSFLGLLLTATLLATPASAATMLSGKTDACKAQEQAYTPIQKRYERGLIFRLEKCGYPTNYIMGTMHSDSNAIAPIFTDAMSIVPGMKGVGFEFVEDDNTPLVAQRYMLLPKTLPQGLSSMIPEKEFNMLASALESRIKLPRQATDRLRPWAAAVTLQYPPPTTDGITLDKRLQERAQSMQKTLFGLETPAEQFKIFDSIPYDKQITMLLDTVRNMEDLDENNAEFMQAYVTRDLITLQRLADESFAMTSDDALRTYLQNNLLYQRNRNMANRMLPHLRSGDVLVAIGALHLMGEKGVLALLEKQGWRVEVVR